MLQFVQARKAVVSNASTWDTVSLLPPDAVPKELQTRAKDTPQCDSFMHLHLGIDAKVLLLYPSTFVRGNCAYDHAYKQLRDTCRVIEVVCSGLFKICPHGYVIPQYKVELSIHFWNGIPYFFVLYGKSGWSFKSIYRCLTCPGPPYWLWTLSCRICLQTLKYTTLWWMTGHKELMPHKMWCWFQCPVCWTLHWLLQANMCCMHTHQARSHTVFGKTLITRVLLIGS